MTTTLNIITPMIALLLGVAFYTLLERKILSYMQLRKGPNKASLTGLLQPFSDATKLLTKTMTLTETLNTSMINTTPTMIILTSLLMLPLLPLNPNSIVDNQFNMLVFMIMSSLAVYVMLLIGWSSNSKYSSLGSMRALAQMISYEVNLFLIILAILLLPHTYNMINLESTNSKLWMMIGMSPFMLLWLVSCLAEVNRSPFDFAEGESELVSGFNVEYSGGLFAMIFMAEYASMIILMLITTIMFTNINNWMFMAMPTMLTLSLLWVRATLPRFRYDMLMNLNWKLMLPLVIPMTMMNMTLTATHH